jgi:hypothetical protein
MSKNEIEKYINEQIAENEISNWHGISKSNMRKLLVTPVKSKYMDATDGKITEYWLVLDEMPNEPIDGYQIIYDENRNIFGLATKTSMQSKTTGALIGFYGSFIDALN